MLKNSQFQLRVSEADRQAIAALAAALKIGQSEAVRRAVIMALEKQEANKQVQ